MKLGEQTAGLLSSHNSLVEVVSAALGGGKKTAPTPGQHGWEDMTKGAGSVEAAAMNINRMLNFG